MRRRLSWLAAGAGAVSVLAPILLANQDGEPVLGYATVVCSLVAVAGALAVAYGHGRASQRWAVVAMVVFCALGLLTGDGSFYAGYVAAILLGLAVAAGEPLPPPDPAELDRINAPMPTPPTGSG